MSADELRAAALALSSSERARLAQELLISLDHSGDHDVDAAWASEISRRAREIAEGTVEPVDAELALDRIRRRLRDRRAETATPSRS
jgi:putative addiction module component (TIGR02574 family)